MIPPLRSALIAALFLLPIGASVPAGAEPVAPPPPLGGFHIWAKGATVDLGGTATDDWGPDRETYFAIEGYLSEWGRSYVGAELGRAHRDTAINVDGEEMRDLDFWSGELNWKYAFDWGHGMTADIGMGSALIYVDGDEVIPLVPVAETSPLADIGFGLQAFADFNWRTRRLLIGLDVKYQYAWDILNLDYSNLRLGGHIGLAF